MKINKEFAKLMVEQALDGSFAFMRRQERSGPKRKGQKTAPNLFAVSRTYLNDLYFNDSYNKEPLEGSEPNQISFQEHGLIRVEKNVSRQLTDEEKVLAEDFDVFVFNADFLIEAANMKYQVGWLSKLSEDRELFL